MGVATQIWFQNKQSINLKLKTRFEIEMNVKVLTHTTTTTTGSKSSQKEVNSQIDLQNSVLSLLKVSSLQVLGFG